MFIIARILDFYQLKPLKPQQFHIMHFIFCIFMIFLHIPAQNKHRTQWFMRHTFPYTNRYKIKILI
jgi:hypothetical protein